MQASVFAGAPLTKRLSVGLSWSVADRRDAGTSDTISLRTDLRLARRLTLGVTGSRSKAPGSSPAYEAFSILSWAYAPTSVANASVQSRRAGSGVNAGMHRGLPAGTGYGYRFEAGSGPAGDTGSGLVEYQWEHGRYDLRYDRLDHREVGTATVAGGIAFLGGRPFLTRPVQDGYGLIRVGVPGIRGYAEGQEIGRTDGRGDLFVPRLLPYYGNRLGIADVDVPVEYQIGRTELLGAPPLRGGVVTRFDVAPLRAVEGELIVAGREVAPAYGELRVRAEREAFSSPIGRDGRFYLESVPAGAHRGEAEWSGGRCMVTIVVPESPPVTDLGPLRCEPDGPAPILVKQQAEPPAKVAAVVERPTATPTATPTSTPTSTPTATATGPAVAMVAPAPPAERDAEASPTHPERPPLPVPPPRGFGPRTRRCPSCAVCMSAALHRLSTPTAQLRCVRDVTVMQPGLGRSGAARMCLATPDWDELCSDCVRMRKVRRCPTWPSDPDARRSPRSPPGRPGGRGRNAALERSWEWSPFASQPESWSMMSGLQDVPATDRSP